jgi:hypothetical protein
MRRWVVVFLGVALLVGALVTHYTRSSPRPMPLPVELRWDVIGTVTHVDFAKGYQTQPKKITMTYVPELDIRQDGASTFTVGPERIHLTDGRVVRVPAHTPGANACAELMTTADKIAYTGFSLPDALNTRYLPGHPCVIIAALDAQGLVQRFSVLNTDQRDTHGGLANVGAVVARRGSRYLTDSGYAFPLDPHAGGGCTPHKGSLSNLQNEGFVDPMKKAIVEIDCKYFA